MIIENKECKYLLDLLVCALKEQNAPPVPDGLDFARLFNIAKKQQIYNIVLPLIEKMPEVPDSEKHLWQNYYSSELVRTIAVNHDRELIATELQKHSIKYMYLKGLVLRDYYPKSTMRQMSDNDILYDYSKRDDLLKIMKSFGYKLETCCENSDDFEKKPFYTFEFHRQLFFKEKDFCPDFDNIWQNANEDENHKFRYNIDVNDNFIYSVAHMYKHFSTNGCGVRFLADIYLLYKNEKSNLNFETINSSFEKMGIAKFANDSLNLALSLFEEKEFTKSQIELLSVFMKGGIYGDSSLYLVSKLEDNMHGNVPAKKAAKKYLIKRIFPSKKFMFANYRQLEKRPYLLMFYYIKRLFSGVSKGKKAINEAKQINSIARRKENKND